MKKIKYLIASLFFVSGLFSAARIQVDKELQSECNTNWFAAINTSINTNNLFFVKVLLVADKNLINKQNENGDTALNLAIESNNENLFKILIDKKPNLALVNQDGNTPLHLAIAKKNAFMAALLFEDPNINIFAENNSGKTIKDFVDKSGDLKIGSLYRNKLLKMAQLLTDIAKTYDATFECRLCNEIFRSTDDLKEHESSIKHFLEIIKSDNVESVLSFLSRSSISSEFIIKGLEVALESRKFDIATQLSKKMNSPETNGNRNTPSPESTASKRKLDESPVSFLNNSGLATSSTLLNTPVAAGKLKINTADDEAVGASPSPLVKRPRIDTPSSDGFVTPTKGLTDSNSERKEAISISSPAATEKCPQCAKLIKSEDVANHKKEHQMILEKTWLKAIVLQNTTTLRSILPRNTHVNLADAKGNTALHVAVIKKDKEFIRILLAKGATLIANKAGQSPLNLAELNQDTDICELLMSVR